MRRRLAAGSPVHPRIHLNRDRAPPSSRKQPCAHRTRPAVHRILVIALVPVPPDRQGRHLHRQTQPSSYSACWRTPLSDRGYIHCRLAQMMHPDPGSHSAALIDPRSTHSHDDVIYSVLQATASQPPPVHLAVMSTKEPLSRRGQASSGDWILLAGWSSMPWTHRRPKVGNDIQGAHDGDMVSNALSLPNA